MYNYRKVSKAAERAKPFSTVEFLIGDENNFSYNFELCFSPTCVAKFHRFLKKEYGSLKNLNKKYESNYTSFEEVKPVTLAGARNDQKLIPLWVDYRRHMENVWAGIYQFSRDTIQKIIPEAKIGYSGSDMEIRSILAADFYKLMQVMRLNTPYDSAFITHALADFAQEGTRLGLGWYGGYNLNRSVSYQRYIPWRHLFRGANSFWVWCAHPGKNGSIIASDFSFYDFFKANIKDLRVPSSLVIVEENDFFEQL